MWLVAGLGNPGGKYERNRHNIGFHVVDALAAKHGLSGWKSAHGGETLSGSITTERGRARIVLLKPMEFMNNSGYAIQRTAKFHQIDSAEILVVHDEIDLEFGIVRLKSGGGHGGHNGLRSIVEQLGSSAFARLRMGVGRDPKSQPGAKDAAGWVLADFAANQQTALTAVIAAGCEDVEAVVAHGIGPAMNQHNGRSNVATP
ncbi:MAG: aminoacyl-tRNA hydrolase [Kofleriaceae bacterium]